MKRILTLMTSKSTIVICAVGLFQPAYTHGAELILREQATPRSRIVRLGDVAHLRGVSDEEQRRLSNLPLMPAPAPGSQHEVSAVDVRDWLAMMGEDLTQIRFAGAPRVVLGFGLKSSQSEPYSTTSAESSAIEDANAAVVRELTNRRRHTLSPLSKQQAEAELKEAILLHVRRTSQDQRPWEIELQLPPQRQKQLAAAVAPLTVTGGRQPWSGSQRFVVEFASERGNERFGLDATLIEIKPVIVATRAIDRNQVVTRADIKLSYLPASQRRPHRPSTTGEIDQVLGKISTRPIQEGEVVYLDTLQPPRLVRRGDRVTAIARGGGFTVRTFAKANRDGVFGDIIEVESLDTKESYFAKVISQGQVAVYSDSSLLHSTVAAGELSTVKK